jgi:hypothetical protein
MPEQHLVDSGWKACTSIANERYPRRVRTTSYLNSISSLNNSELCGFEERFQFFENVAIMNRHFCFISSQQKTQNRDPHHSKFELKSSRVILPSHTRTCSTRRGPSGTRSCRGCSCLRRLTRRRPGHCNRNARSTRRRQHTQRRTIHPRDIRTRIRTIQSLIQRSCRTRLVFPCHIQVEKIDLPRIAVWILLVAPPAEEIQPRDRSRGV